MNHKKSVIFYATDFQFQNEKSVHGPFMRHFFHVQRSFCVLW